MLLFVGKWCLFILDFFVHSCVVSVLSQSLEKIPSKEGGGGGGGVAQGSAGNERCAFIYSIMLT